MEDTRSEFTIGFDHLINIRVGVEPDGILNTRHVRLVPRARAS